MVVLLVGGSLIDSGYMDLHRCQETGRNGMVVGFVGTIERTDLFNRLSISDPAPFPSQTGIGTGCG